MPAFNEPKRKRKTTRSTPPTWRWGEVEENDFTSLKSKLITYLILAYPDWTHHFEVHTDASRLRLRAILSIDIAYACELKYAKDLKERMKRPQEL